MAFSFGASNPAGGNIPAEMGPELPDVFAEEVGFKGISSDSNVRLLPTPWPADALPAPTCTLLAVAPTQGVVVGAGPDSLQISSSDAVRKAISAPTGEQKIKTKPFDSQAKIPLPGRPTHIAFAWGESALVLATQNGPQIAVFQTSNLLNGGQPTLSIPTNGATFRSMVPNPAPMEDTHSPLVALVTDGGELLIADLKAGNLLSGPNGQVLKTGVSSVCWSNKGKQLVAGLADGTGFQMTPEGVQKDLIPRPMDLEGECHVSSVAWLENDIFLMVYTLNSAEDEMGGTPPSSYYVITRRKQAPFLIQKLPELCMPFGVKRAPAYQFIARLRDYKPHLKDALIVSSTASTDVGLITRSDQPLAKDPAAQATAGLFTMTEVNDDTKRASVPLNEATMDETSVIGLGLDLTSTDTVVAPIAGEDIAESATPVPGVLLLNNEGILSAWWFIYAESIRQKVPYHGLTSAPAQPSAPAAPAPAPSQPAFGQPSGPAMGGANPFGKPSAAPAFGSPSALGGRQQPTFGTPSFGTPSFGQPAFGGGGGAAAAAAPAFGTPSQPGTSFGAPSSLGQNAPQFGKPGFGSTGSAPAFGQPSTPGKGFSSFASPGGSGGGFGSFANAGGTGGFAGLAASKSSGESPFGKMPAESPFGKPSGSGQGASLFGNQNNQGSAFGSGSAFGAQKTDGSTGGFGLGSGGFKLESSFKGDGSAANDLPKPEKPSGGAFSFGGSFDDMVSTPNKASSPAEEAMDDTADEPTAAQPEKTEQKPPAPSLFGKTDTSGPSLFGSKPQPQNPFGQAQTSQPSKPFSLFGNAAEKPTSPMSPPSEKTAIPSPKQQPTEAEETPSVVEPPLPPDPTSRAVYGPGDTSASSNVSKSSVEDAPLPPDFTAQPKPRPEDAPEEAPLPPDFTSKKKDDKPQEDESEPPEEAPLPPDPAKPKSPGTPTEAPGPLPSGSEADESGKEESDDSDFSGSGEDVGQQISDKGDETGSTQNITPEDSFGSGPVDKSPPAPTFLNGKPSGPQQQQPPRLFGEVAKPLPAPASESRKASVPPPAPGSTLAARKASLTEMAEREDRLGSRADRASQEVESQRAAQAKQQAEEEQPLSEDDEEQRLRADLERPLEPVPTLDPFLPHQDYAGESSKPGVPGQIEKLYRDINSMVDTLGINSRSLSAFMLYQQSSDNSKWMDVLQGDNPAEALDQDFRLAEIQKLDDAVAKLAVTLEQERVDDVGKMVEGCREILNKGILHLRGQLAGLGKTLATYNDEDALVSAPLSAEQATIQNDMRTASSEIQTKIAELESAVTLLRAKITEAPRPDGSRARGPSVEAVTRTIDRMTQEAENKRGDVDYLKLQLNLLKFSIDSPTTREGTPVATPKKSVGRLPVTPGSKGSIDGSRSAYHTPESAKRSVLRSSINGSARASRFRTSQGVSDEGAQWKARTQRKQTIAANLKKAVGEKQSRYRGLDDDNV